MYGYKVWLPYRHRTDARAERTHDGELDGSDLDSAALSQTQLAAHANV